MRGILASCCLTAGLTASAIVPAAPDATVLPVPAASGRIAGSVIGAETGVPVRFAEVTLTSGAREWHASTGDAGGFAFDGLGPGGYTLHVSKPGYLDTTYGQSRPGTDTPGRTIPLGAGERIDRLTVPLSHGAAIAGTVRDERGEPAFQATVTASRWVLRDGRRALDPVAETQTDERGRYRLPVLPSRAYIVSAAVEGIVPATRDRSGAHGFAPSFFPAETSAEAAIPVSVNLGDERTDADLQVGLVPVGQLAGTVVDVNGRPAGVVLVSLHRAGSAIPGAGQAVETDAAGRFAINDLIPGTYIAHASDRPVATELEGPEATRPPRGAASAEVTVQGAMATEVVLTLHTSTVSSRERPAEVSGTVFDASGQPVADRRIVIFSTSERLWAEGQPELQIAAPTDGRFQFVGLRPGSYHLAVVDGVERDEWLEPAVLRRVAQASVPVTLGEGERKVQDVRIR